MPDLDDDRGPTTRHDAVAFLVVGLLGLLMLAIGVAALVLPPGIAFALIRRGLGEDRPSWVVLGGLAALIWLVFLYAAGKRLLHRGERAAR